MRAFHCQCGGRLFFHSMSCVVCGAIAARCPHCHLVASMSMQSDGSLTCNECERSARLCQNRLDYAVCNAAAHPDALLCRYCAMNRVIPDLAIDDNLEKWRLLERAKHRVLYGVDRIGLPIVTDPVCGVGPVLVFEFKAAVAEPISTGHASGTITINIAEADSVHREQNRVEFGEPHRTLVGHFRHELGHYFWDVCVKPSLLSEYRALFGDERSPSYEEAKAQYYAAGPPTNWWANYVSQYATMHSWEDFAETFNAYLDMVAIVETSTFFERILMEVNTRDFDSLLHAYRDIGIVVNELNRDMGLLDLVTEVFTPTVIEKLRFIHSLRL